MTAFVAGLATIAASGLLALLVAPLHARAPRRERAAQLLALVGLLAGAALAAGPAWEALRGTPHDLHAAWSLPGASFTLKLDRLAGFFALTILLLGGLSGVYGLGYLDAYRGKKALGPPLLLLNLLVATMCLVVTAANAVLFLFAWELMTLLAFFLVTLEDEEEAVRRAGLTYLVMCHLGTVVLLAFFLLLARGSGSLDFEAIAAGPRPAAGESALLFGLALVGFGSKIGIWPLHTWLPLAHPAAPSHVSALMSGVIVKVALYALVRGLTLVGPPTVTWGVVLVAVGAASGALGVLFALAQHDLKRLLAYSTIENVGVIVLGLGVGALGVACQAPVVAVLGFAGGLLHVLNHALFKGLLFFGAGAVMHATHTRDLEQLGGLLRRMPWTGAGFLVASVAVCGLPPLNGFVSEWLIYASAGHALLELPMGGALAALAAVASLALIGGLSAVCFAKAFGVVFLGHARSAAAADASEAAWSMRAAMLAAAVACVAIGLLPALAGQVVLPLAAEVAGRFGLPPGPLPALPAGDALEALGRVAALLLVVTAVVAVARKALVGRRPDCSVATWGCGYGAPTARMQYTGSSFADPLLRLSASILRPHVRDLPPTGPFPGASARATHTGDWVHARVYLALVHHGAAALRALRPLQQGRMQLYLLYLLLAVLALLGWDLWAAGA